MKFLCTERFFEGRTYYENEVYDLTDEQIAAFKVSGQIKRLRPLEGSATAASSKGEETGTKDEKPLEEMNKAELLEVAKNMQIPGAEKMNKGELIDAINIMREA